MARPVRFGGTVAIPGEAKGVANAAVRRDEVSNDGRAGDPEMIAVNTLFLGGAGGASGEEGKGGRTAGRDTDRGEAAVSGAKVR